MAIADDVKKAVDEFEAENPKLKGQAYLTSGDRSVEEQLQIILDPKRKDNYLNIKERFKKKFKLDALPERKDLTADDKIEAMSRRGFAQFQLHDYDTAERTFSSVLWYFRSIEHEERLQTDFYLGLAR